MSTFKFFTDNQQKQPTPLEEDFRASWMWTNELDINRRDNYIEESTVSYGIRNFLSMFPHGAIVPIVSISGQGITHDIDNNNQSNGWGFDILEERLFIRYLRYQEPEVPPLTRQRIEDEERMSRRFARLNGVTHQDNHGNSDFVPLFNGGQRKTRVKPKLWMRIKMFFQEIRLRLLYGL